MTFTALDGARMTRAIKRAQTAVLRAVRSGRIVKPASCERCGTVTDRLDAHHSDYSRTLDVVWLCRSCHSAAHAAIRAKIPKRNNARMRKWGRPRATVRDNAQTTSAVEQTGRSSPDRSRQGAWAGNATAPIREKTSVTARANHER